MEETCLRLRLVVRRHALPEVRIVFNVSLDNDATIANLLEQVNETIPLESATWGLEDYVVELRNQEGQAFECLHFQQISTVLEKDEEVVVRPLFPRDRKKRVLSGRHQISVDGRHLVDGIPFGRPRLKPPRERPAIEIPPLKRRRIDYSTSEDKAEVQGGDDRLLLLTEKGEAGVDDSTNAELSASDADFWDPDENEDSSEDAASDNSQDGDSSTGFMGEEELEEELRALQEDNIESGGDAVARKSDQRCQEGQQRWTDRGVLDLPTLDKLTTLRRSFPEAPVSVCEQALLQFDKDEIKAYNQLSQSYRPRLGVSGVSAGAGPSQSAGSTHQDEQSEASDAESMSTIVKRFDSHGSPSGSISSGLASTIMTDRLREGGHVQSRSHIRLGDDNDMDSLSLHGAEDQVVIKVEDPALDTESESDSGSDSGSDYKSDHEGDSESDSERHSESDSEGESEGESENDSHSGSESESNSRERVAGQEGSIIDVDSDASSSSSEIGDDSGPEVASSKPARSSSNYASTSHSACLNDDHDSSETTSASEESSSDDSSSDSDDSEHGTSDDIENPEEGYQIQDSNHRSNGPGNRLRANEDMSNAGTSSSETKFSAESSNDETSSSSSNDESSDSSSADTGRRLAKSNSIEVSNRGLKHAGFQPRARAASKFQAAQNDQTKTVSPSAANLPAVAPGQGKTSTKNRNARKRARKASLKDANAVVDAAIFAKKTALLASLESQDTQAELEKDNAAQANEDQPTLADGEPGSAASQRRMRLDIGASRRMLFSGLGLRNPKSKADEDKIRAELMKSVRPHINSRLAEDVNNVAISGVSEAQHSVQENPDAWRDKITYRAVECCHDSIKLSEPPFPFVQRWDPQQQGPWMGKKSGRGRLKRKRDQLDFSNGQGAELKKRKFATGLADVSAGSVSSDEIILNYDEESDNGIHQKDGQQHTFHKHATDQSQLTDVNDLPSLPSDLSVLAPLHSGQARPGMVITWKQLFLLDFQPQLSNVTGMVIDSSLHNTSITIVLARRDRTLGKKAKRYDDQGQRVYDKFDAPDSDGEGDDPDNGYRTLHFCEMMEPRIVQQPLPLDDIDPARRTSEQEGLALLDDRFMAKPDEKSTSRSATGDHSTNNPTTFNHDDSRATHSESGQGNPGKETGDSIIPHAIFSASSCEPQQGQIIQRGDPLEGQSPMLTVIIGCIEPDVHFPQKAPLDLNSPSLQLEEASEMAGAVSREVLDASSIPLSAVWSNNPPNTAQSGIDSRTSIDSQSDVAANQVPEEAAKTPHGYFHTSFTSSIRSGRQPDPDFSIDLGIESWNGLEEAVHGSGAASELATSRPNNPVDSTMAKSGSLQSYEPTANSSPTESPVSSSSFPSLSEIFLTAKTSRSTQSPAKGLSTTKIKKLLPQDIEYEAAMRLLDGDIDGSDNEDKHWSRNQKQEDVIVKQETVSQAEKLSRAKQLLEKPIDKPAFTSPPKITSRKTTKYILEHQNKSHSPSSQHSTPRPGQTSGRFTIPEGSQVISLLTSSPEPKFVEDYADDSIDETYGEAKGRSSKLVTTKRGGGPGGICVSVAPARTSFVTRRIGSTQRSLLSSGTTVKPSLLRSKQAPADSTS